MFEKLSNNLNMLMAKIRISADELARRTNVPASTIKKIRNNNNPNPTLTTLLPLADFFSITLGQLVGNEPLHTTLAHDAKEIHHIPILSWRESISWPATTNDSHNILITQGNYNKNAFALIVEEDNWENLVKNTILFIDPSVTPEHRDFVITHKTDQALPSLKQILYDDGAPYLKSIIVNNGIIPLTSEYKILGVVIEYKKQLKNTISTALRKLPMLLPTEQI